MPDEKLEEIAVLRTDLEKLRESLGTLYHYALTHDLADQYKNLDNEVRLSPITTTAREARDRINGYLKDNDD